MRKFKCFVAIIVGLCLGLSSCTSSQFQKEKISIVWRPKINEIDAWRFERKIVIHAPETVTIDIAEIRATQTVSIDKNRIVRRTAVTELAYSENGKSFPPNKTVRQVTNEGSISGELLSETDPVTARRANARQLIFPNNKVAVGDSWEHVYNDKHGNMVGMSKFLLRSVSEENGNIVATIEVNYSEGDKARFRCLSTHKIRVKDGLLIEMTSESANEPNDKETGTYSETSHIYLIKENLGSLIERVTSP